MSSSQETCECQAAGFCQRYKKQQSARCHQICRGESGLTPQQEAVYRSNWAKLAAGVKPSEIRPPPPVTGPGTELKLILDWWIGRPDGAECGACSDRAAAMDRWGPDKCEQNIELIAGWLQESAWKLNIPMVKAAFYPLIRAAIERARQKTDNVSGAGCQNGRSVVRSKDGECGTT